MNLENKQAPYNIGKVPYIPLASADNVREGFLEYDDHTAVLWELPRSQVGRCELKAPHHTTAKEKEWQETQTGVLGFD